MEGGSKGLGDLWLFEPTIGILGVGAVPVQIQAPLGLSLAPNLRLAVQGALIHQGVARLSNPVARPSL